MAYGHAQFDIVLSTGVAPTTADGGQWINASPIPYMVQGMYALPLGTAIAAGVTSQTTPLQFYKVFGPFPAAGGVTTYTATNLIGTLEYPTGAFASAPAATDVPQTGFRLCYKWLTTGTAAVKEARYVIGPGDAVIFKPTLAAAGTCAGNIKVGIVVSPAGGYNLHGVWGVSRVVSSVT